MRVGFFIIICIKQVNSVGPYAFFINMTKKCFKNSRYNMFSLDNNGDMDIKVTRNLELTYYLC